MLPDREGTPQLVLDGSASTVWSALDQPYGTTGTVSGSLTQSYRLPGQTFDAETGFHQNWNRDYMPNLGRYLEADPTGLWGGMNPYTYVDGAPESAIDPSGLVTIFNKNGTSVHANPGPRATVYRPEHDPPHIHLDSNDGPRVDTKDFRSLSDAPKDRLTKAQQTFCKSLTEDERALIRARQAAVFETGSFSTGAMNALGVSALLFDWLAVNQQASNLDLDPFSLFSYQLAGGGTLSRITLSDGSSGLLDRNTGAVFQLQSDGSYDQVY